MTQQIITNGDTGLQVRTDLNDNFTELFGSISPNVDTSSAFQWTFDAVNTDNSDPGAGKFKFNNADSSLATRIYMSSTARNGVDVQTSLNLFQINSQFFIKKFTTITDFVPLTVIEDPIDNTGWFEVPIEAPGSTNSLLEGDICDFSFTGQKDLSQVIHINTPADLPDAVAGVRELGGAGVARTYLWQAGTVDIGTDRLEITGGVVVIRGSNRYTSTCKSNTGTGVPLIAVIDGFYAEEFMNYDNASGDIYDVDNTTGPASSAFVSQNCVIRACENIGTITQTNTVSLRTFTVVTTSVGGLVFSGTDMLQLNLSQVLGASWTGTLFDISTNSPTWDIINWTSSNRFTAPSGATVLSGLAVNGNLTTLGKGLITGNTFEGLGTFITGITQKDLQWKWLDNQGIPHSADVGCFNLLSSTLTTITMVNVWTKVLATTVDCAALERFAGKVINGENNELEYLDDETISVLISASMTSTKSGAAKNYEFAFALDTGSGFNVLTETISPAEVKSTTIPTPIQGAISLDKGDKLSVFVRNITDTDDLTITSMNVVIH